MCERGARQRGGVQGESIEGVSADASQDCSRRERNLAADTVACDAQMDDEFAPESSEEECASVSSDMEEAADGLQEASSFSGTTGAQGRRRLQLDFPDTIETGSGLAEADNSLDDSSSRVSQLYARDACITAGCGMTDC